MLGREQEALVEEVDATFAAREVGAELSQHQGHARRNLAALTGSELHLGLDQIHDGGFRQAAMCVGEHAKDEWHSGGRWNRGVGWVGFQTAQHTRKRLDRGGAKVVRQFLAELAEGAEDAQLAENHPQVERVLCAGDGDQGFQRHLVQLLQVPFQIPGHQLLAILDVLETPALVDPHLAGPPMREQLVRHGCAGLEADHYLQPRGHRLGQPVKIAQPAVELVQGIDDDDRAAVLPAFGEELGQLLAQLPRVSRDLTLDSSRLPQLVDEQGQQRVHAARPIAHPDEPAEHHIILLAPIRDPFGQKSRLANAARSGYGE